MHKGQFNQNIKTDAAALSACKANPILQPAHGSGSRQIRIALPAAPRRPFSAADRLLRKALYAAELAFWRATGGDFLRSPQPN